MRICFAGLVCLAAFVSPTFVWSATSQPTAATTQPIVPALQQTVDIVLNAIEKAQQQLPAMAKAADVAAERWINGAELFAGGDSSFTDEAFYRAGGLIGLRRIGPISQKFNGRQLRWDEVPEESVVLYGLLRNVAPAMVLFDELAHLAYERDTVVFFGSSRWPATRKILSLLHRRLGAQKVFFIDTHLPADTSLVAPGGQRYGDYASIVTAVHMWTFTAEMVAACTRQGKTPGIWPSGSIPRYDVWEKKYESIKFHDDIKVAPIEAGRLGTEYLQILRKQVIECLASGPQVQQAAKMLANVPKDKAVYAMVESHLLAGEAWLPAQLSNWLLVQRSWRWQRAVATLESGDGILWLGYIDWPDREMKQARQQKNPFVGITVRAPGEQIKDEPLVTPGAGIQPVALLRDVARDAVAAMSSDTRLAQAESQDSLWLPAPWQYPDAVVEIPGYPLPACPTSGIIQGTLLWAVVGETLHLRPIE